MTDNLHVICFVAVNCLRQKEVVQSITPQCATVTGWILPPDLPLLFHLPSLHSFIICSLFILTAVSVLSASFPPAGLCCLVLPSLPLSLLFTDGFMQEVSKISFSTNKNTVLTMLWAQWILLYNGFKGAYQS